mmetsp:Transcript_9465/g.36835  ORF Transcript_9465/g.36835 Transcript_9465/m.36835 type:complete len:211 (+) Transcript_9465:889-1521(+)
MSNVGDFNPHVATATGRSAMVLNTRRSRRVVPRSTATAGVSAGKPDASSLAANAGSVARPMYTTSVVSRSALVTAKSTASATALPSPVAASFAAPSRRCPVSSRTDVATPRWVSGMPSSEPTPAAAVMPGTMRTSCPRWASASISSPPLPNTSGSPPLSLTIVAPFAANASIIASISSCVRVWYPDCLPTYSMVESGETRSRICGETSRS